MRLITLFIVFVVLLERTRSSNIMFNVNEPDGFAELGDAAIQIVTTCSATPTKTVALASEFPGDFIKKLSNVKSFALVQLDYQRRSANNINWRHDIDPHRWHKVDVFVTIAADPGEFNHSLSIFDFSLYANDMALILVLVWSPEKKYTDCDGNIKTVEYFHRPNTQNHLKTILMCHNRMKTVMMYSSNPYTDKAPKAWKIIPFRHAVSGHYYSYFVRQYREHEDMCKNLDYDKTHDLGGSVVKIAYPRPSYIPNSSYELDTLMSPRNREMIVHKIFQTYIYDFITRINGTKKIFFETQRPGYYARFSNDELPVIPYLFMTVTPYGLLDFTYPYGENCNYLMSQYRGHKSQLQKIFNVVDYYTWIGLCLVYLVSLMFLKYFFGQPLIEGILNLIRLTCNGAIIAPSLKMSSRIYMGCLLFIVVTMQGIFMGNLAALLTHDFPARQINSIPRDLIDLDYKVYVNPVDEDLYDYPAIKGRVIYTLENDECIPLVQSDPMSACISWGPEERDRAPELNLHVSSQCTSVDSYITQLPRRWPLRERINGFLMWSLATDIMLPLDAIVAKKRLFEQESQKVVLEPRVMIFGHLHFAFNTLGIGLTCALVCFIIELIVHRYNCRVTTTRIIDLHRSGHTFI